MKCIFQHLKRVININNSFYSNSLCFIVGWIIFPFLCFPPFPLSSLWHQNSRPPPIHSIAPLRRLPFFQRSKIAFCRKWFCCLHGIWHKMRCKAYSRFRPGLRPHISLGKFCIMKKALWPCEYCKGQNRNVDCLIRPFYFALCFQIALNRIGYKYAIGNCILKLKMCRHVFLGHYMH